jgi:hypothetical protein
MPPPPPQPPIISPDGYYQWSGDQWLPRHAVSPQTPTPTATEPERLVLEATRHKLFYYRLSWFLLGVATILTLVCLASGAPAVIFPVLVWFGLPGAITFAVGRKSEKNSKIVLTTRRVGFAVGVLRKRSFELLLTQIESVGLEQDAVGRIFGYGTVVVRGTGGSREVLDGIVQPERFLRAVQQQVERVDHVRYTYAR